MGNAAEYHYGPVTDYSIKSSMTNDSGRGWTWGVAGSPPIAAINNLGDMQLAGTFVANKLGIGLSNPNFGLSLYSSENQTVLGGNTKSVIRLMNSYADAFGRRSEIQFGLEQSPTQSLAVIAGEYSTNNGSPSGDLVFGTKSNTSSTMFERMRIKWDGNVGIGTTTPDAKLAVKGTVHAQEVKVDLNVPGPDYVFEENYNLPSLTEIENYIKQNKHLPEVPSAKAMEANGINLSEMNMLLLKKVEELTLHMIDFKKDMDSIKEENKKLKDEVASLKKN
jgi:hypothetical protein